MSEQKYQNLHSHTITSDGKLTYKQTLDVSNENNVGVVAFTDHDSLPNKRTVKELKNFSHPVRWILGIEISSGLPKELGGKPASNFHIVGLFVNPFDERLREYCKRMQAARVERMEKIVKNLQGSGLSITDEDCLKQSKGETVNRPHIVAALLRNSDNIRIIEHFKQKMAQESRHNSDLERKYSAIKDSRIEQCVYALFFDIDSYIKGINVDYLYGLELDRTVEMIRNAGGVAVLAHWTSCKKQIGLELLKKLLKEKRLDGIEKVYNPFRRPRGMRQEVLADMQQMKNLARRFSVLQSGGADSHAEDEIVEFFKDRKLVQKTIGLAEEMLRQRPELDNEWQNVVS